LIRSTHLSCGRWAFEYNIGANGVGMKTRRVIVTGVSGGIGRAIATYFASQGYKLFGIDKVELPPDLLIDRYCQLDLEQLVASPAVAQALAAEVATWTRGEGLAALVNNAAVQIRGSLEDTDLSSWNRSLCVNVLAPFFLVRTLLTHLEQGGGSVINISSIHARLTKPGFVAYSTTKAALSGLTRAMAVDLGSRIRVNAIEPAAIETPMLRASFEGREVDFERLAACHPQGRVGSPDEVAALVYALVAGEFRFLHGACIDLSGGISARLYDPI
jgi:NAD(P)-dependent dehydrogenase (short-subunit alcohol dehydrogenase family)